MVHIEEIVSDDFVVVVGSVCKSTAPVTVTYRPDAGHVGLQLIVNENVTAFVRCYASLVETEVAGVGDTPYREQNMAAHDFRRAFLARDLDGDTTSMLRQRDAFRIQAKTDSFGF